jgi:hypothetical protein
MGFNFFQMLVVDLLHEFELGVWKALFIHLLRILEAMNPALLHQLDQRYVCPLSLFVLIAHCDIATGRSQLLVEIRFEDSALTFLN